MSQEEEKRPEIMEDGEVREATDVPVDQKQQEQYAAWATPQDVMRAHLGSTESTDDGTCRLVGSILYLNVVRIPTSIIDSLKEDMPRYGVRVVVLPGAPANHLDLSQ